ncbi:MAG: hypothetical protein H6828_10525 [Planctomycetes bacterium]|nr:hypothetical protein [Planctomycetota bacterium]
MKRSPQRSVASGGPPGAGTWTGLALRLSPFPLLLLGLAACGQPHAESSLDPALFEDPPNLEYPDPGKLEVEPPPFSEGVFPCTDCHEPDLPVKGTPRKLTRAHQDIELHHGGENRWCLDCHSAVDFDKLHLAGGELIDFEESYRLCGQCHGDKYRDWRRGIHGRRSGHWDGEKTYLLCVHCHYSHAPAFKPLEPMPAPKPPVRTP